MDAQQPVAHRQRGEGERPRPVARRRAPRPPRAAPTGCPRCLATRRSRPPRHVVGEEAVGRGRSGRRAEHRHALGEPGRRGRRAAPRGTRRRPGPAGARRTRSPPRTPGPATAARRRAPAPATARRRPRAWTGSPRQSGKGPADEGRGPAQCRGQRLRLRRAPAVSSRSGRSRPTSPPYASGASDSAPRALRQWKPSARSRAASSSVDLPIPGSPSMRSAPAVPPAASASSASIRSSSGSRPSTDWGFCRTRRGVPGATFDRRRIDRRRP